MERKITAATAARAIAFNSMADKPLSTLANGFAMIQQWCEDEVPKINCWRFTGLFGTDALEHGKRDVYNKTLKLYIKNAEDDEDVHAAQLSQGSIKMSWSHLDPCFADLLPGESDTEAAKTQFAAEVYTTFFNRSSIIC